MPTPAIVGLAALLVALSLIATSCHATADPVDDASPDPAPPATLSARVYIEADYDTVWDHFTKAEHYAAWSSAPCREFGRAPGDAVVWGTDDWIPYRGELTHFEKGDGIAHTMQFVGFGFEEPATSVGISIVRAGPTVLVELHHDVTGAPQTAAIIGEHGWLKSLCRLKTLLERGTPMAWPQ